VLCYLSKLSDLKPQNILVGLERLSVLDNITKTKATKPSPRKVLYDQIIYLSRNNFRYPESSPGKPMIIYFNIATFGNTVSPFTHRVQPNPRGPPKKYLRHSI
jgi:hypothetical protein